MAWQDDIFEKIEAYLDGTLEEKEKVVFENTLANDPALREELELQQDSRVLLTLGAQLDHKKKLQAFDQALSSKSARVIPFYARRRFQLIAASFLVLFGAYFLLKGEYSSKAISLSVYEKYPDLGGKRSESSTLSTAQLAYNTNDFEQAIPLFLKVLEQNPNDHRASFYLAHSYMGNKAFGQALAQFDGLQSQAEYGQIAEWNALLACLAYQDPHTCQARLSSILANPKHDYFSKAQKLEKSLKNFWVNTRIFQ